MEAHVLPPHPSVIPMNTADLAADDGSLVSAGRGSGLSKQEKSRYPTRLNTLYQYDFRTPGASVGCCYLPSYVRQQCETGKAVCHPRSRHCQWTEGMIRPTP